MVNNHKIPTKLGGSVFKRTFMSTLFIPRALHPLIFVQVVVFHNFILLYYLLMILKRKAIFAPT